MLFQVMPRNSQLDTNFISMKKLSQKSYKKDNINFNKKCSESIVVPDHDVNSFTTFEIKTEPKINDDDLDVNSFSVVQIKTENDSMLTCDDVSTNFCFFK